jgi:carbonic anhydrase
MTHFPERLTRGYQDFLRGAYRAERDKYLALAEGGQRPQIMVIGCCDSRAAPETIFSAGPGEIFVLRNVANLVPPYAPDSQYHGTSAAIEFAVLGLEVRHIVVLGHARCGGIAALSDETAALGESDFVGRWMSILAPALDEVPADGDPEALELASIGRSLDNLRGFPFVARRLGEGQLALHGAHFDIATGKLRVLDEASGTLAEPGAPA